MRGLEDVAVLPGMGCAGESGTGPPEAGAEQPRRRAPPLAERSRGLARGADVLVLAGTWKGFFFHNLLVGLGLGYAKPYLCSPLATPVPWPPCLSNFSEVHGPIRP